MAKVILFLQVCPLMLPIGTLYYDIVILAFLKANSRQSHITSLSLIRFFCHFKLKQNQPATVQSVTPLQVELTCCCLSERIFQRRGKS